MVITISLVTAIHLLTNVISVTTVINNKYVLDIDSVSPVTVVAISIPVVNISCISNMIHTIQVLIIFRVICIIYDYNVTTHPLVSEIILSKDVSVME